VIAATDVTAIRIPGEVVARVLQEQPALSNQFARIWQARADVLRRSGQQAAGVETISGGRHSEGSSDA
jgi:CRP-like cAMP-binding protein